MLLSPERPKSIKPQHLSDQKLLPCTSVLSNDPEFQSFGTCISEAVSFQMLQSEEGQNLEKADLLMMAVSESR